MTHLNISAQLGFDTVQVQYHQGCDGLLQQPLKKSITALLITYCDLLHFNADDMPL